MASILRRSMASLAAAGPSKLPPHVGSAAATAPAAVRERRAKYPGSSKLATSPINDPALLGPTQKGQKSAKVLPPQLEAEFQALRKKGQYKGDEASGRKAFLLGQVAWRSRVRGVKETKVGMWREIAAKRQARLSGEPVEEGEDGDGHGADMVEIDPAAYGDFPASSTGKQIVGKKIYLPNLLVRLVRNHTPPGEAYDPYLATFRIPLSMTKTDLRSYLSAVYDLPVTFIRTTVYLGKVYRTQQNKISRQGGIENNYKKAVVGLLEPFHYPDDLGELEAQGRQAGVGEKWAQDRREWLEKHFYQQTSVDQRKLGLARRIRGPGREASNGGTAADKARVKAAVKRDYEKRIGQAVGKARRVQRRAVQAEAQ